MAEVGIRELKQNASAVVARAAGGETLTITDRGRPVATMTPLPLSTRLQQLIDLGLARPACGRLADLPAPATASTNEPTLSSTLAALRDGERF